MSGGHSGVAPPESIPNSEVKHTSADGSVGSPHARVGHRQTINKTALRLCEGLFLCLKFSFQSATTKVLFPLLTIAFTFVIDSKQ